jgi:hypothetical protein
MTKKKKKKFTVTNDSNHMSGAKRVMSWPELAADIFPDLQRKHSELQGITLAEFIEHCPFKMEFVLPDKEERSK